MQSPFFLNAVMLNARDGVLVQALATYVDATSFGSLKPSMSSSRTDLQHAKDEIARLHEVRPDMR